MPHRLVAFAVVLLGLLLLVGPVGAQTWTEFPNSKYDQSAAICGKPGAQPAPNCVPPTGQTGSAISAWVDGDYDPATGLFIIPRGGGHGDGQWNGVPAFRASDGTWVLLTPPSLNVPPITTTQNEPRAVYPDGTPSSVHSYGAVAWMPWLNKMWSAGGIYWSQAGESQPARTWWWDPTTPQTPVAAWKMKLTRPGGYGTYAVADPTTKRVLFRTSGQLFAYDPAVEPGAMAESQLTHDYVLGSTTITVKDASAFPTSGVFRVNLIQHGVSVLFRVDSVAGNVFTGKAESGDKNIAMGTRGIGAIKVHTGPNPYTQLFSQTASGNSALALDNAGRKIYRVSNQTGGGVTLWRIDLNNLAGKEVALATAGGPATAPNGAGLLYDAQRVVMLGPAPVAGKSTLWTLVPVNCGGPAPQAPCQWTQHVSPDGIYSPASDTGHGTWKKFYRHQCDYIHIITGAANVWKVRPAWQTDTCQQTPTTYPLTITPIAGGGTGTATPPVDSTTQVQKNQTVVLSFAPIGGSTFTGWTGDPDCTDGSVTMTGPRTCTPNAVITYPLTINPPVGGGTGTSSPPAGTQSLTQGTVVTLQFTPTTGTFVGWTGDPDCTDATVTMTAARTCTPTTTPPDAVPPVITLTSPALNAQGKPQVYSGTLPIQGTITDNVGVTGTIVTFDGQPFSGEAIDTTTLPNNSYHTLVVRAVDAAGNSSQATVEFLVFNCPVCPTPTAAILTVITTGPGHGTVTGPSGPIPVGTAVTLTPTPAEDSLYLGTTPTSCGQPFSMPAQDLTCSFAFDLKPPPPPSFSLGTVVVGQGTVTGAGEYIAAAPVTLGGSPASGWVDQGWSPTPCAATFPMPAQNLVCTRTYTQPPPPTGTAPIDGLIARTWKPIPYGTVLGQSKHARVAFDSKRKRMVIAGGDGTDGSGNSFTGHYVHSIDLAQSATITRHHGACPPVGAPQLMPYKSDNTTWVYDSKRDNFLIAPAYYDNPVRMTNFTALPTGWTILGDLAPNVKLVSDPAGKQWAWNQTVNVANQLQCNNHYVPDFSKRPYTFDPNTNLWAPATVQPGPGGGWGGDSHNHFGVYDPVTDSTYRFWNGCGVHRIPMDGTPGPACYSFAFPNTPAGGMDPSNDQSAIDVQGRHLYVIARYKNHLLKWSLDQQKVVKYIPMPATWRRPESEYGGGDYETHMAFDTKNRVLMIPHDMSYGSSSTGEGTLIGTTGENRGVYFFNVDTEVWEHELAPVGAKVSGNVLGYDAANNVFLYFGRSPTKQIWLYRYK
jgi:hypothetical protein